MEWEEKHWEYDSVNYFLRNNSGKETPLSLPPPAPPARAPGSSGEDDPQHAASAGMVTPISSDANSRLVPASSHSSAMSKVGESRNEEAKLSDPKRAVGEYPAPASGGVPKGERDGAPNGVKVEATSSRVAEKILTQTQTQTQSLSIPYVRMSGGSSGDNPVCQVDGCRTDLSQFKEYYRRHRVCEMHAKVVKVSLGGEMQRFCQQCSRFHLLEEFDEGKRSCRRRLLGHNKRRRKQSSITLPNSEAVWSLPPTSSTSSPLLMITCQTPETMNMVSTATPDSSNMNLQEGRSHGELSSTSKKPRRSSESSWNPDLIESSPGPNVFNTGSTFALPNSHSLLPKDTNEKVLNATTLLRGGSNPASELPLLLPHNLNSPNPTASYLISKDFRKQLPHHLQTVIQQTNEMMDATGKQSTTSSLLFDLVDSSPLIGASRTNNSQASVPLQETESRDQMHYLHSKVNPSKTSINRSSDYPWADQLISPVLSGFSNQLQSILVKEIQPVSIPSNHSMGLSLSLSTPVGSSQPVVMPSLSSNRIDMKTGYQSSTGTLLSTSTLTSSSGLPTETPSKKMETTTERTANDMEAPGSNSLSVDNAKIKSNQAFALDSALSSSEERTGSLSFKLFDHACEELPKDLQNQVLEWLSHRPSAIESYIRPGCVVISFIIRMSNSSWIHLTNNLNERLKDLVSGSGFSFWSKGAILVQVENQSAFIHNGVISDIPVMNLLVSPTIAFALPLCATAGEETILTFQGNHLLQADGRVICHFNTKHKDEKCSQPELQVHHHKELPSEFVHEGKKEYSSSTTPFSVQSSLIVPSPSPHELKVKFKAGAHGECGRTYFQLEHMVGSRVSNVWPTLIAESQVCSEIRTLEKYLLNSSGLTEHTPPSGNLSPTPLPSSRIIPLLHDLGFAFQELQSLHTPKKSDSAVCNAEPQSVTLTHLILGSQVRGSQFTSSSGRLSDNSLKSLISFSVKWGWWATSKLLLDLAMLRGSGKHSAKNPNLQGKSSHKLTIGPKLFSSNKQHLQNPQVDPHQYPHHQPQQQAPPQLQYQVPQDQQELENRHPNQNLSNPPAHGADYTSLQPSFSSNSASINSFSSPPYNLPSSYSPALQPHGDSSLTSNRFPPEATETSHNVPDLIHHGKEGCAPFDRGNGVDTGKKSMDLATKEGESNNVNISISWEAQNQMKNSCSALIQRNVHASDKESVPSVQDDKRSALIGESVNKSNFSESQVNNDPVIVKDGNGDMFEFEGEKIMDQNAQRISFIDLPNELEKNMNACEQLDVEDKKPDN